MVETLNMAIMTGQVPCRPPLACSDEWTDEHIGMEGTERSGMKSSGGGSGGRKERLVGGQTEGRASGHKDGWAGGCTDARTHGRTDSQMGSVDEEIYACRLAI